MKVTVTYMAQAKKAVGAASEVFELDNCCTIYEFIVDYLCERHKKLKHYIMDEHDSIRKAIAIFVGDTKIDMETPINLRHEDEITIIPPIAGG